MSGESSVDFDPARFERGSLHAKTDGDSDSCGMWQRGHLGMVALYTGHGAVGVQYPLMLQHDEAENCRWITIRFRGVYELSGPDGDVAEREGMWRAEVKGERLGIVLKQLFMGHRLSIRPSGKAEGDRPQVDEIRFTAIEPDGF